MQIPIELNHNGRQSLQAQLFDRVRDLILSGRLRPGARLPATRDMSRQLNVSRNTVLLTYDQLIAEGYLQTRAAVGTFVSPNLPERTIFSEASDQANRRRAGRLPPKRKLVFTGRAQAIVNPSRGELDYDFWVGRPDPQSFPLKTWRKLLARSLARAGSSLTEYRNPAGLFELRQAITDRLGPARGITTTPEQVIIVGGSQEGLNIAARLLLREGDRVVIEDPCYQGAVFVFESCGAELIPVPVDDEGMDVSRLPEASVSLVYATPSHQYPMGATLSLSRRMRLLDWAWRSGAYIIEDDYDSDFRYNAAPLTALKGLDRHGCTIYLGTFSKSLGAGIRIGYLVVPRELAEPAARFKALLDNGNPWLEQATLAEFIAAGGFDSHLRRIRQTYMDRRDALVEALHQHFGAVDLRGLEGGMHLVWHLPTDFPTAAQVEDLARLCGVGVYAFSDGGAWAFDDSDDAEHVLMFGYSSLSESQIREGVCRLAAALEGASGKRKACSFCSAKVREEWMTAPSS